MEYKHIPALLEPVLEYLQPRTGGLYIDATLGGGGYTFAIAKRAGSTGKVLSIDLDNLAIANANKIIKKEKIKNVAIIHDNFKNLQQIINQNWPGQTGNIDGIVFDLGLSSAQLADESRGFSFQLDAPLDMAFGEIPGTGAGLFATTEYIVNKWKREKLVDIFFRYGEEKHANRIATEIVRERDQGPIKTTRELAAIIESAIPVVARKRMKIHPATRTFQALRIATNKELENLEKVLPQAIETLKPGGRIAVVSYHSLEDRIVKHYFRSEARECQCPPEIPICRCHHKPAITILTKHIIKPSFLEAEKNPRSRSAKLRVAKKI